MRVTRRPLPGLTSGAGNLLDDALPGCRRRQAACASAGDWTTYAAHYSRRRPILAKDIEPSITAPE